MDTQKVVFVNKQLGLRLAGLLYIPDNFDLSKNYPAIVVTGPMLSVKEQAQSVYAKNLTAAGYVTLVFDGSYFGESEGQPRGQELPDVKESDIEAAVDYLTSLPYVDSERIGGLGICGSGSYMSVAGVKEPRIKAVTAIVPAISDISTSPMMGFFKPADEVTAAKEAYDKGVIITGSQNLYTILRVLEMTWKQVQQIENQEEMMKAANMIVDRVQSFYERFLDVEKQLNKTQEAFTELKNISSPSGKSIEVAATKLLKFGAQENPKRKYKLKKTDEDLLLTDETSEEE